MIRFLVELGWVIHVCRGREGCKRQLTALLDCRAFLGELDEYDIAEAFLRIVRDGHRPNSTLIVKGDQLVI